MDCQSLKPSQTSCLCKVASFKYYSSPGKLPSALRSLFASSDILYDDKIVYVVMREKKNKATGLEVAYGGLERLLRG